MFIFEPRTKCYRCKKKAKFKLTGNCWENQRDMINFMEGRFELLKTIITVNNLFLL